MRKRTPFHPELKDNSFSEKSVTFFEVQCLIAIFYDNRTSRHPIVRPFGRKRELLSMYHALIPMTKKLAVT